MELLGVLLFCSILDQSAPLSVGFMCARAGTRPSPRLSKGVGHDGPERPRDPVRPPGGDALTPLPYSWTRWWMVPVSLAIGCYIRPGMTRRSVAGLRPVTAPSRARRGLRNPPRFPCPGAPQARQSPVQHQLESAAKI